MNKVIAVRLKPGLVGETKRVVHAVVLPSGAAAIGMVTTACGQMFSAEDFDVVGRTGMVCVHCAARLATAGAPSAAALLAE